MTTNCRPLHDRLQRITLTGIDEHTSLDSLYELSERHPKVEFGVLFSNKPQGNGRYPSLRRIEEFVRCSQSLPGLDLALHVCGSAVHDLLTNGGAVSTIAPVFPRIQLNFSGLQDGHLLLKSLMTRHPNQSFITQHNHVNKALWLALVNVPNHCILFDASRGAGVLPGRWPKPLSVKTHNPKNIHSPLCGYAGGLGPDNLLLQLGRIGAVAGKSSFWIDMESSLRDDTDRFDVSRARKCLEAAEVMMLQDKLNSLTQTPPT